MSVVTVLKGLIGVEDINFMTGGSTTGETFSRTTSTGGSQSMSKVSAKAIPVEDSNSIFVATDVENVLVELMRGINYPGIVIRPQFTWKDTDEIYIDPGVYHHHGTTVQLVYWDSQITFQCGSAGSNSGSSDLTASAWHYIYLDDSAIVTQAAPLIDADCFLNSTTGPTWSAAKHGWYNGLDRCIYAGLTNASSQLLEHHHSGNLVMHADRIQEAEGVDIDTTWTDVDCATSAPSFCRRIKALMSLSYSAATATLYWRTNGIAATNGHICGAVTSGGTGSYVECEPILDSSQIFELKMSVDGGETVSVHCMGWFFPIGM